MLTASAADGAVRLDGDLPPGSVAYVDAEWLPPGGEGSVPALVVEDGARIRWESRRADIPAGLSDDEAAAAVLWQFAGAAAELAADRPPGRVEVCGSGVLAGCLRRILAGPAGDGERPAAVVDTTGDPEVIATATERLRDSGVLVLAGESHGRPVALNLYPDVHARGLRLRGIAPRLEELTDATEVPADLLAALRRVAPGTAAPDGRDGWLRVAAA